MINLNLKFFFFACFKSIKIVTEGKYQYTISRKLAITDKMYLYYNNYRMHINLFLLTNHYYECISQMYQEL